MLDARGTHQSSIDKNPTGVALRRTARRHDQRRSGGGGARTIARRGVRSFSAVLCVSTVFLSPHNDDETLFGAFTLLRERPHVIVVLRSFVQEARGTGVTYEMREAETAAAMEILGCTWEQWEIPDNEPDWSEMRDRLRTIDTHYVYAPAVERGGHAQHNKVGELARDVFRDRATHYLTYTPGKTKSARGRRVPYESWMVAQKLRALACYVSQHQQEAMVPHFLREQYEYYE